MFGFKKLNKEVEENNIAINERVNGVIRDMSNIEEGIDKKLDKFKLDLDKFESNFRKEIIKEIAEKFFDTLDKIFRTTKEISLISTLASNVNNGDYARLRSELLRPFLEARQREEKIKKGEAIVNKGVAIIEKRRELHNEYIVRERQGEKPEKLNVLKAKIEMLDEVIGGLK